MSSALLFPTTIYQIYIHYYKQQVNVKLYIIRYTDYWRCIWINVRCVYKYFTHTIPSSGKHGHNLQYCNSTCVRKHYERVD